MAAPTRPRPTTISSTDLQRKIGEITRRAAQHGEHFIVARDGFPTLAVISVTEYATLTQDRHHLKAILQQSKPQAQARHARSPRKSR